MPGSNQCAIARHEAFRTNFVRSHMGVAMQKHIEDLFEEKARAGDGQFAIAFALMQLTHAQKSSAAALRDLGLGDTVSPMGAIEFLSTQVRSGFEEVASALDKFVSQD